MPPPGPDLAGVRRAARTLASQVLADYRPSLRLRELGRVRSLRPGIALVEGLPRVRSEELVVFPGAGRDPGGAGLPGIVFHLEHDEVGVVLLARSRDLRAGDEVRRTGRRLDVPVGEGLIGRVVSPLGEPLDEAGPLVAAERWPVERPAPAILDRAPVTVPLQTGWKVVDALIPIGRGQRELIIGDRQTGKSTIAIDAILNQRGKDVICIYCAIGQRSSATAGVVETLASRGAMEHTVVVVAAGHDPPGLQYVTPYAATSIGEYFAEAGRDVLIVYDDLSQHARAYRELSLLLRRPPGREAYPGDIFYLHSRLLERATQLRRERGGGSLTALPIIETQAQDISAYIPTNLISITDGQIYLSPELMRKSIFPAVDVGRSVSRVGGRTQLPALRGIGAELRLSQSQFQEMELFTRFGTRLDPATRQLLDRGRRIREVLRQREHAPLPVGDQVALLLAAARGWLDELPESAVAGLAPGLFQALHEQLPDLGARIARGEELTDEDRGLVRDLVRRQRPRQDS